MNIENANPLGFVIANADEEFLAHFKHCPGYTLKAWVLHPNRAQVFPTRKLAQNCIRLLDHYQRLFVLDLFETEHQLILASSSKDRPHWLHAAA